MLQGDMMTKKRLKKEEEWENEAKWDKIKFIIGISILPIIIGIIFFYIFSVEFSEEGAYAGVAVIYKVENIIPQHTLYLQSDLFPIKITSFKSAFGNPTPEYAFYGTIQPNGTECISRVAVYQFNYTIQKISSIPEIIYNPEKVADIYYSSVLTNTLNISMPNGYTLLCPDIVNAIK